MNNSIFSEADLVSVYTRAEALQDGVLVDVSAQAKEHGFKVPMALTHAAWHECVAWDEYDEGRKGGLYQSPRGRLADLLNLAMVVARNVDGDRAPFEVWRIPRDGESLVPGPVMLVLTIHGGDHGEPVCTIMEPGED